MIIQTIRLIKQLECAVYVIKLLILPLFFYSFGYFFLDRELLCSLLMSVYSYGCKLTKSVIRDNRSLVSCSFICAPRNPLVIIAWALMERVS